MLKKYKVLLPILLSFTSSILAQAQENTISTADENQNVTQQQEFVMSYMIGTGFPNILNQLMVLPQDTVAIDNSDALDSEELEFLNLINQYRSQNGLSALQAKAPINSAAAWLSRDMGYKNYFSHTDSMGRGPYERMTSRRYFPNSWGEIIAAGNSSAAGAFSQWKNSPPHNSIMLGRSYHSIGIGRAYNATSTYKWYWTCDFGDL